MPGLTAGQKSKPMIKLYDDQQPAVDRIKYLYSKGIKRIVLCAATGWGKTIVFTFIAWLSIKKGSKVLVLTDRIELLTQTNGTLGKFGIQAEIFKAGSRKIPTAAVVVAMAETIKRRLKSPNYITWLQDRRRCGGNGRNDKEEA